MECLHHALTGVRARRVAAALDAGEVAVSTLGLLSLFCLIRMLGRSECLSRRRRALIASLVGFITLFGIVTRNGIMLISPIRHLDDGARGSLGLVPLGW